MEVRNIIRKKIDELIEKRELLTQEQQENDRYIRALRTTLEIFNTPIRDRRIKSPAAYNGMTPIQAIRVYAGENQDIVESRKIRPLLVDAGLLEEKSAPKRVHTLLSDEKEFRKIRRGEYRWIPNEQLRIATQAARLSDSPRRGPTKSDKKIVRDLFSTPNRRASDR